MLSIRSTRRRLVSYMRLDSRGPRVPDVEFPANLVKVNDRMKVPRQTERMSTLRLGPTIVRRQALEDWLRRFKNVPVRFLIAPPGFGKTMVILGYLRHCAIKRLRVLAPSWVKSHDNLERHSPCTRNKKRHPIPRRTLPRNRSTRAS